MASASLLGLPQEVRDEIIEYVLNATKPLPDIADVSMNLKSRVSSIRPTRGELRGWTVGIKRVKWERSRSVPNCQALRLVNRSLSQQTLNVLQHLAAKSGPSYVLDVILAYNNFILPTWLCIPVLSQQIGTVMVTCRTYGTNFDRTGIRNGRNAWYVSDGGPPTIWWHFYHLLERLLVYGPVAHTGANETPQDMAPAVVGMDSNAFNVDEKFITDKCITVREIIVDFVSDELTRVQSSLQSSTLSPQDPDLLRTPKDMATFLSQSIGIALDIGYYTAQYGARFYERVGSIELRLEGKFFERFDLGERLAATRHESDARAEYLPAYGPFAAAGKDRLSAFWRWKKATLETRRRSGLPMRWPDDVELRMTDEELDGIWTGPASS